MKTIDGLRLRKRLGRDEWSVPVEFGPDGWLLRGPHGAGVIATVAPFDGVEYIHASIAKPVMPSYDDLVMLHRAVFGQHGYAYQVFAPRSQHVNIHATALHLWGRADGAAILPEFGAGGSI